MSGWVKLHRQILQSKLWRSLDADGKVVMITLLLRAAHRPVSWRVNEHKEIILGIGELFISVRMFAKEIGVKDAFLRTILKQFAKSDFIKLKADRSGTKIKIINWERYQQATLEETEKQTSSATPLNEDVEQVDGKKDGAEKTGNETDSTTHNKNNNNENENNKNQNDCLKKALDRYQVLFGIIPTAKLTEFVDVAITVPDNWLVKSFDELVSANKISRKRSPLAYWLGILRHWKVSGNAEPWQKAKSDNGSSMINFYASKGVNVK